MAAARPSPYPRVGEPIAPRLLRPLLAERGLWGVPADAEGDMLWPFDLGADAWRKFPPDACRRLALVVVDRVQTRLRGLPELIRGRALPSPAAALSLPLERRTANTLRRAANGGVSGPWTVGRYLSLPRFGGRALVDLLSSVEAHGAATTGRRDGAGVAPMPGIPSEHALARALALIVRRLPISEQQTNARLQRLGLATAPVELAELAHAAVRYGREPPFRVVDVGGARVAVGPSQSAVAAAVCAIATRTTYNRGAATIRGVADQAGVVSHAPVDPRFVERLLPALADFRWLDRRRGWFWFAGRPSRLLEDLRKLFAVAARMPLARLWAALSRAHHALPSPQVLPKLCAGVPDLHVAHGLVTIDHPFARAEHLTAVEDGVVEVFEAARAPLTADQLRALLEPRQIPWRAARQLLRSSPLFEASWDGFYRLVGTG